VSLAAEIAIVIKNIINPTVYFIRQEIGELCLRPKGTAQPVNLGIGCLQILTCNRVGAKGTGIGFVAIPISPGVVCIPYGDSGEHTDHVDIRSGLQWIPVRLCEIERFTE